MQARLAAAAVAAAEREREKLHHWIQRAMERVENAASNSIISIASANILRTIFRKRRRQRVPSRSGNKLENVCVYVKARVTVNIYCNIFRFIISQR